MIKNEVIGILDSGVGGLTVASEVMRQLPKETVYYFGDTLRCPYGPRTAEEVKTYTFEIIQFLLQYPLKAIVIACNTATAFALSDIREKLPIPVLGVIEPGARAAIKVTQSNQIGVIGTQGTIHSGAYEKALKCIHPDLTVYSLACPTFAPLVENGLHLLTSATEVVAKGLKSFSNVSIDTLILGCTHYPLLQDPISQVIGEDVTIISSAKETATELSTILQHKDLLADNQNASHRFFTTGKSHLFLEIAENWLGRSISVETVKLIKNVS